MISANASEEMRDKDDSPYLSQGEEPENEHFSTAVDLEIDCCEVDISNESPVICDTFNVLMFISKVRKIPRFFSRKSPLKNQILQKYVQEDHWKNITLGVCIPKQGGIAFSRKLHEAIIKRIEQRRNSNLVGMLHYLNSGKNNKR